MHLAIHSLHALLGQGALPTNASMETVFHRPAALNPDNLVIAGVHPAMLPMGRGLGLCLQKGFYSFWETAYILKLWALKPGECSTTNRNNATSEPGFSAQVALFPHTALAHCKLKLSQALCCALLKTSLGEHSPAKAFSLNTLSVLEEAVLQRFTGQLGSTLKQALSPTLSRTEEEDLDGAGFVCFTFFVVHHQQLMGSFQLQLSLPLAVVLAQQSNLWKKPDAQPVSLQGLNNWFKQASSVVHLLAGSTRMPLSQCHTLEVDDMVLLEASHCQQLLLQVNGETHSFPCHYAKQALPHLPLPHPVEEEAPTHPNPSKPVTEPYPMSSPSKKTGFIDQLNVDVEACFEPLRLPIEQLRQLEEGVVLEVGELINNTIHLKIDGNTIASGELVVLGDKFGVLVTAVQDAGAQAAEPQSLSLPAVEGATTAKALPTKEALDLDPSLVQALQAQGMNVEELIAAAQASGQEPNTYLAQVWEDHFGTSGEQAHQGGYDQDPAEAAMAEVDRMLEDDSL